MNWVYGTICFFECLKLASEYIRQSPDPWKSHCETTSLATAGAACLVHVLVLGTNHALPTPWKNPTTAVADLNLPFLEHCRRRQSISMLLSTQDPASVWKTSKHANKIMLYCDSWLYIIVIYIYIKTPSGIFLRVASLSLSIIEREKQLNPTMKLASVPIAKNFWARHISSSRQAGKTNMPPSIL